MAKLLLCSCAGTQNMNPEIIAAATGHDVSPVHHELCGADLGHAAAAIEAGEVIIACGQQAAFFAELAEELAAEAPPCVDIRDRAGWSRDPDASPKMAALLAEAARPRVAPRLVDVHSDGVCLVIGAGDVARAAAARLADSLIVTLLLTDAGGGLETRPEGFEVISANLRRAAGSFGDFTVEFDALREISASGRGAPTFGSPADGAASSCDLILDLGGGAPLFPADHKRDGYFKADPGDPGAVADAVFAAAQMVGSFEKPLYVRLEDNLCAHSRARQTGCSRCLDICPTGAILPDGDHVAIDPGVCAGCGACSAVCPSGAISYDDPPVGDLFARMRVLAETYATAGGTAPRLLVHDAHGAEMIRLASRHFNGLPAAVLPIEINALSGFGHAEILAALGVGFADVDILLAPQTDRSALDPQIDLANAISGRDGACLLDIADPEALSDHLFNKAVQPIEIKTILPLGGRREVARLAASALRGETVIDLPPGAPYGAVLVDQEACTLCLSCAGQCPPGALLDDEDHPRLRFREDACLQCGICAAICPEDAITLKPQLDLTHRALEQKVVKEEEPFACIECGKLFGVKSTIEKIVTKLEGNHAMFTNSHNANLIRMCDDCRVNAQFHADAAPFQSKPRPAVRRTEDYLEDDDA